MASFLYRIGSFSYRHCWAVLSAWVVLLVATGLAAWQFHGPTDDSFVIPDTEAQDTIDLLQERFPERGGGTVQVVFAPAQDDGERPAVRGLGAQDDSAPSDLTEEPYRDAITAALEEMEEIDGVEEAVDPYEPLTEAEEDHREAVEDAVSEARDAAAAAAEEEVADVPEAVLSAEEREGIIEEAQDDAEEEVREEAEPLDVDEILEELPYADEDRELAVGQVRFEEAEGDIDPDTVDRLLQKGEPAESEGLAVHFAGSPIDAAEVQQIEGQEAVGVGVALVLLAVNFGALVAAGMPILVASVGVGAGMAGIYSVSGVISLPSTAPILALMLGIALGIDYSLFILSRYRQLRATGTPDAQAAAWAVGTAGTAVVFAGVTNVIAVCSLAVVRIPFLTIMGVAAAGTITAAVLVTLTLLPALFAITRGRITALKLPVLGRRAERAVSDPNTMGARWVRLLVKQPLVPIIAVVGILIALILPVRDLHLALPTAQSSPEDSTQRVAYDAITEGLGEGYNGPLAVVIEPGGDDTEDTAEEVQDRLEDMTALQEVFPPELNDAEDTAVLTAIPEHGPTDLHTEQLLDDIRALDGEEIGGEQAALSVTGATAMSFDISERLGDAMPVFLAVVVGLALILLAMVFRSIAVPGKTALSFALSTLAALGATVIVFQWGYGADALGLTTSDSLLSFLPILVIAIMFGLAMDYEVFLVSRMREHFVRTGDAQAAVVNGYRQAARVVTVAALIMISVFGFFIWGESAMIQPIAFALAVGVTLDALLVRMTLVPAVMALLGRAAWWLPRWMNRALPDMDAEGYRLEQRLAAESRPPRGTAAEPS